MHPSCGKVGQRNKQIHEKQKQDVIVVKLGQYNTQQLIYYYFTNVHKLDSNDLHSTMNTSINLFV